MAANRALADLAAAPVESRCRLRSNLAAVRHVMHKTRSGRKFGSWLALIALAIQFAVSFAHVHLDGVGRAGYAGAVAQSTHGAQPQPAQQPSDDGDDYCAICASIYLAANSFVPAPPVLPVPLFPTEVDRFDRKSAIFIVSHRLAFQSRAPPLA